MSARRRVLPVLFAALLAAPAAAGTVTSEPPEKPDPAGKYLFYMHGREVETGEYVPQAGPYDYDGILAAFAKRGFTVIGEKRGPDTRSGVYATQVSEQVRVLLGGGVPAHSITVAGHSKGGEIALLVASRLRLREINYVILAGCIAGHGKHPGKRYQKFVKEDAPQMRGRILSVYDEADLIARSCKLALDAAPDAAGKEMVLHTGRGHYLFYQPQAAWLDIVQAWAEGK